MRVLNAMLSMLVFTAAMRVAVAQDQMSDAGRSPTAPLVVRSNLVVVPAFVKTRRGEQVFSLATDDFVLTDDGIPQKTRLELDTDSQPLALVVVVQAGSLGATHLRDYGGLHALLEAMIGAVPHRVAVVSFDSVPHLEQDFDGDTEKAADTIADLDAGDNGGAILDALVFATDLLRKQPARYRRSLLLLSETVDGASEASLNDALKAVDETNTAIYSFAFSSTKAALKHEGAKLPRPFKDTEYSATPYKKGGCMSREPDADPDAHGSRVAQALDCAGDLLPPFRIARMAYIGAVKGMQSNVPETVANLTGGEYFSFKDAKSLRSGLVTISNDVPNRYVLTFQPASPHGGLHALSLSVKAHPELTVRARTAYWVTDTSARP